jgi:hypothetical protein
MYISSIPCGIELSALDCILWCVIELYDTSIFHLLSDISKDSVTIHFIVLFALYVGYKFAHNNDDDNKDKKKDKEANKDKNPDDEKKVVERNPKMDEMVKDSRRFFDNLNK